MKSRIAAKHPRAEVAVGISLAAILHGLLVGAAICANASPSHLAPSAHAFIAVSLSPPPGKTVVRPEALPALGIGNPVSPRRIDERGPGKRSHVQPSRPMGLREPSEIARAEKPAEAVGPPTNEALASTGDGESTQATGDGPAGASSPGPKSAGAGVGGLGQENSPPPAATPIRVAAHPLVHPRPPYPREARLSGWEGTVVLRILVDTEGQPAQVTIAASSGHALLDDSALATARAWRFSPALENGRPTAMVHEVRFRFRLDEGVG